MPKNAESALGAFIEAVDSKRIPKGSSYLIVEGLDRLSRDKVPTAHSGCYSPFMDEQVYSEANINDNWTKLVVACAILSSYGVSGKVEVVQAAGVL